MALGAVGLTTHIANNHLKSALLLAGFPLLLALLIGAFFAGLNLMQQWSTGIGVTHWPAAEQAGQHLSKMAGVANWAVSGQAGQQLSTMTSSTNWAAAGQAGWTGLLTYGHWALIGAGVWFVIAFMGHTAMIRLATGAMPVTRQQMPKIYNMLENLCISQGMTMPQFDVIDSPALNAFASGISDRTYRITLTRGLIERLQDDELEAVIAHELAHIRNRDVRLLIISVVFVGMISFFAEMAFRALVHGVNPNMYRRRNQQGGGLVILLLALVILAVGYVFALVIRFALSRKREYLADAGAVEMTRNPEAMMRALLRISSNDQVRGMPDEVQQMCIENSHKFMGIFATHPPIAARVDVISRMTDTPVPTLQVSLKRPPRRPWDGEPRVL